MTDEERKQRIKELDSKIAGWREDALAISDQILDLDNEIKEMEDEKERLELGEDDESLCLQES